MRILLVEDNLDLADSVVQHLRRTGNAVDHQADGLSALRFLEHERYDLVLLDIGLPAMDGLSLLAELRRRGDATPVLMLTERSDIEDRISALDVGADDYIGKPFDFRELAARCRALTRRRQAQASSLVRIGPMTMDNAARRLRFEDRTIDLPNREYSLLEILVGRLGQVVSKAEITNRLFALSEEAGSNTVELYVARLRKKLPQQFLRIVTVRGTGYLAETLRECAQARPAGGAHE